MATNFSIFLLSQMPLSRLVSLRRRFTVLRWDPSRFLGGETVNTGQKWTTVCVQWSLVGEARAGLRCNNSKPTFQKALGFRRKLLLFGVGAFILRCYNETNEIHVFFLHFMVINKKRFHIILESLLCSATCLIAFCTHHKNKWSKLLCAVTGSWMLVCISQTTVVITLTHS